MKRRWELGCSEAELSAMIDDLDAMHHATLPTVRGHLAEMTEQRLVRGLGRRGLVLGGLALVGAAAAGCTSVRASGAQSLPADYKDDLRIAALAAALESLGVGAYQVALDEAGKGTYGTVPSAVGRFISTAQAHHQDHAASWNSVLAGADRPAVTTPALKSADAQLDLVTQAKTIPALVKAARDIENMAAATYLRSVRTLTDGKAIAVAATIAPVEAQHAAILGYLLGEYPAPDAFLTTKGGLTPEDLNL